MDNDRVTVKDPPVLRDGLLDALPDAMVIAGDDGRILEVNSAAEALFGYERHEMIGQLVEIFAPVGRHDAHRRNRERFVAGEPGTPSLSADVDAVRKDGSQIPVDIRLTRVHDGDRSVVVAAVRDMSAQVALRDELKEAHSLITQVFDSVTEQAVIACDLEGHVTMFNPGAERLLGYTEASVLGSPVVIFHDLEEVTERARAAGFEPGMDFFAAGPLAGRPNVGEWTFVTADRHRLQVSLTITAMRDAQGKVTGFIGVATDITARKEAEKGLATSEERFRLSFENAPVGMMLIGLKGPEKGVVLRANRAMSRITGLSTDDLTGSDVDTFNHPSERALTHRNLEALAAGTTVELEKLYRHADGHAVPVYVSASVVRDLQTGEAVHAIAQVQDISERKAAESELHRLAMHDPLTGLGNRALLFEHVRSGLGRAERNGQRMGLLFIDLDDFKLINDSMGHDAGDEYLLEIVARLKRTLRRSDFAARFGGDEFVVACEGISKTAEVEACARRVRTALSAPIQLHDRALRPSASIGVAVSTTTSTAESLLRDADAAMYRAKELGKGRYEVADASLQARAMRVITVESELQHALANDELRLHYQPCFDLATMSLVGVEALLRWQHPEEGLLLPASFLEVAEARDLIVPIGAWALEEACRQAAAWSRQLEGDGPEMWVNISSRQLGREQFAKALRTVLQDTGLDPSHLWLEIAERQLATTDADVLSELNALPNCGVHLAIDDFGTGHNALDYLRYIRAGALKIDNQLVAGLGTDQTSTALTSSIITLGRTLGLAVVAEGVETPGQLDALRDLGCGHGQGYLLGRPTTADRLEEMLGLTAVQPTL